MLQNRGTIRAADHMLQNGKAAQHYHYRRSYMGNNQDAAETAIGKFAGYAVSMNLCIDFRDPVRCCAVTELPTGQC